MCLQWLKGTFLYQCILANPKKFFPTLSILENDIIKSVHEIVSSLVKLELIQEKDSQLKATTLGTSLTHQNIGLSTVKHLDRVLEQSMDIGHLLRMLCQSPEFREVRYQSGDKTCLHKVASHPRLRFIADRSLHEPWLKVFYLIQTLLQADLDDCHAKLTPSLKDDLEHIQSIMTRLLKCKCEIIRAGF